MAADSYDGHWFSAGSVDVAIIQGCMGKVGGVRGAGRATVYREVGRALGGLGELGAWGLVSRLGTQWLLHGEEKRTRGPCELLMCSPSQGGPGDVVSSYIP